MSNKKLTQTKADEEPTYTEMVFEAIDNLELATLENIDLFLSNTYQVQNKLILTNVVDWLLESNILKVEYKCGHEIENNNVETTENSNNHTNDDVGRVPVLNYNYNNRDCFEPKDEAPVTRSMTQHKRVLRSRIVTFSTLE